MTKRKISVRAAARAAISEDRKVRDATKQSLESAKRLSEKVAAQAAKGGKLSADSFQNFVANIGIGTDNISSAGTYGFNPITRVRTQLEWMHRGSWLAGAAVDAPADDMTRGGVDVLGTTEPDDIEALDECAEDLVIWGRLNETIKWSRLYGGALAVLMIEGQDWSKPLRVETVGPGQFKGLLVLDRWMVEPTLENLVTEAGPDIGLPKFYRVTAQAPALPNITIHYSRCIRMEGLDLPYWQKLQENLWGLSVIERLYDRMLAFDSATQGAAQLVYKAYVRTYKIDGLRQVIAAGGDALQGLMQYASALKWQGIEGITLLDGLDEMEAMQSPSFTGIAEALAQFAQQLSGALEIPLVRLFGQSPAGFSSGDSELKQYYDTVLQRQNRMLKRGVVLTYRVMAQSCQIKLPQGFRVKFKSLWQLTEKEKADTANTVVQAVTQAVEAGLQTQQGGMKELRQSSAHTGIFSNITDADISAASEEVPPPPAEQVMEQQEGDDEESDDNKVGSEPRAPKQPGAKAGDAEFNESEHPRKDDGKFGKGSGGGASAAMHTTTVKGGVRTTAEGAPLPAHIQSLKLPPAWTDVRYSADPGAKLLAVGRDSKGRPQSVYSAEFQKTQAAAKFARVKELSAKFAAIQQQNAKLRKSEVPRVRDSADALALIMATGIRPGSDEDTGAAVKAYGATTLEGRHVVKAGAGCVLKFVGKKGVALNIPVEDRDVAAMLLKRAASAGAGGKLFPATSDKALLEHAHSMDGGGFKTKDFRTHLGTATALFEVSQVKEPPKDDKEYRRMVMEIAKKVSAKLGNTPTIALQSYINPAVFAPLQVMK